MNLFKSDLNYNTGVWLIESDEKGRLKANKPQAIQRKQTQLQVRLKENVQYSNIEGFTSAVDYFGLLCLAFEA